MTVADLFQLPPVREKRILAQFPDKNSMKHLLRLQLQHLLKYAELTEVLRQNDKLFIDLLNKVRIGDIGDGVEKLLITRFTHESDENYPKDTLLMYTENELAKKMNETALNGLPGEFYTIEASGKFWIIVNIHC